MYGTSTCSGAFFCTWLFWLCCLLWPRALCFFPCSSLADFLCFLMLSYVGSLFLLPCTALLLCCFVSILKMAVDWRYFWYMELSRRLHSRYRLVDYIWVKSQVCEHGSDSNNSIYSSFIGLRWSNNGRHCFKSYSEHVLASHNLLFCSDTHYLLHNTRILWTQIKISVKTTFSRLLLPHSRPPIKGAADHL